MIMNSETNKNIQSLLMEDDATSAAKVTKWSDKINLRNLYLFSNIVIWLTLIVMFSLLLHLMHQTHTNFAKHHEKHPASNESTIKNRENLIKLESGLNTINKRIDFFANKLFSKNSTLPIIEALRENIEHKMDLISHEVIPIGFIYIQLPHQSPPVSLWHWAKWEEITSNYSGHFFRAEGNGSEPFGIAQEDAIRDHNHSSIEYSSNSVNSVHHLSSYNTIGTYLTNGLTGGVSSLAQRYVSDSETRPKNYAVKIWIRIL